MKKIILAILILGLAVISGGDSIKGRAINVTFNHTAYCDSVFFDFAYPNTANYYKSIEADSIGNDGRYWVADTSLGLDSIGTHTVRIQYYLDETGVASYLYGSWYNSPDTSAMQGAASGLTADDVAERVLDTLIYAGLTAIPGSEKDTIYILTTSDSTAIQGVTITAVPYGGGTPVDVKTTSINGRAVLTIDPGYVDISLFRQGYSFADSNHHLIATQTDTLYGTRISAVNQVTILASLTDAGGDTINPAYVYFQPVKYDSIRAVWRAYKNSENLTVGSGNSTVVVAKDWRAVTSTTSGFSFGLYSNAVLSDTSSRYSFIAYYKIGANEYENTKVTVKVPDVAYFNPFD